MVLLLILILRPSPFVSLRLPPAHQAFPELIVGDDGFYVPDVDASRGRQGFCQPFEGCQDRVPVYFVPHRLAHHHDQRSLLAGLSQPHDVKRKRETPAARRLQESQAALDIAPEPQHFEIVS
jgi:hypothetical protein